MKKLALFLVPAILLFSCFYTTEEYRSRTATQAAKEHQKQEDEIKHQQTGAPIGVSHKVTNTIFMEHNQEGVYLAVDASSASINLDTGYDYLPLGIYIANRAKRDIRITENMIMYKTGESWENFPPRTAMNGSWLNIYAATNELRGAPLEQSFQELGRMRLGDYLLRGYYAAAIMYIKKPSIGNMYDTQFVRFKDDETNTNVECGFLLKEKK